MNKLPNELMRKNVVEEMWLHYYNDFLLDRGAIPKNIHTKMKLEINLRTQRLLNGGKSNVRKHA